MGVSSIGGKRAFWGGGAQVWLRETRAATWGRPYGQIGTFWGGQMRTPAPTAHPKTLLLFRRAQCPHRPFPGGPVCRPYGGKRNRSVGLANSGAELEPHRLKFLHTQAPVGRREFRLLFRFCAPEMFCPTQGVTSVMGDRGKAVIGERSSPLRRPPAILW